MKTRKQTEFLGGMNKRRVGWYEPKKKCRKITIFRGMNVSFLQVTNNVTCSSKNYVHASHMKIYICLQFQTILIFGNAFSVGRSMCSRAPFWISCTLSGHKRVSNDLVQLSTKFVLSPWHSFLIRGSILYQTTQFYSSVQGTVGN
jgi:hypothetical protein